MAPRNGKRKRKGAAPPTQAEVAAAVVHLGRLAAAHANWGVTFSRATTEDDDCPIDDGSVATLAEVVALLLKDRQRMWGRNADLLKARLHDATTGAYAEALNNEAIAETVEELVDQFARTTGFALGTAQSKRFAVDVQHIKERTPSQAAAEALLDGIKGNISPTTAGRSIFDAKERQMARAPIPAPMNRYVPLPTLRRYFEHVVDTVEAQRMPESLLLLNALPVDARVLPEDAPVEALQHRVEALFKKQLSAQFEGAGYEDVVMIFRAILNGEQHPAGVVMTPEIERRWALLCEGTRALRMDLLSPYDGDPAVLEQIAHEVAQRFIRWMKEILDAE